jgi:hypothetical protein
MMLSVAQLQRLLVLVSLREDGPLKPGEDAEFRELIRLEGYSKHADSKDAQLLTNLGYGILMAYYFVDGVDFTAEAV